MHSGDYRDWRIDLHPKISKFKFETNKQINKSDSYNIAKE